MATPLSAIRLPPDDFGAALRRAWDAGEAVLPLPVDAPDGVVNDLVAALRPQTVVAPGSGIGTRFIGPPIDVGNDTALVIATSGSTGRPKGVVLTHTALAASVGASIERLGCKPGERWLLALPVHHIAGIQVLLRAWALGSEPVVVDPSDTAALAEAEADHVSLVPTQLARLVDAGADLARFRTILAGGGPAEPGLLARARQAGGRVVRSYGMTETCGGCVYDGEPLDGVEIRVTDDHHIAVRGAVLFTGYLGDRDKAAGAPLDGDGWFTTGDVGRIVGGRLEVLGRGDDVVVSGGENVPLDAVGAALCRHPAVADAAAAGRADPEWGTVVVAIVVPADPAAPPGLDELRRHVTATSPPAYAPRALVLTDALPRDHLGKLARAHLDVLAAGG